MKLVHLLKLASRGYPDRLVTNYFDKHGNEANPGYDSDTLAEFIAIELRETYDPDASDTTQLQEAMQALRVARDDLEGVIRILEQAHLNRLMRDQRRQRGA